ERYAGVRSNTAGGGDPEDDLEGDARGGERLDLLPAAAEHKRIAALQPQHALALACQPHQQGVDFSLAERVLPAFLARVNALRVPPAQFEDGYRNEMIVDDDFSLAQQLRRTQCQQLRIAGPRPDQIDDARAHGTGA